jgi:lipoyl(octanoyl) transferase
MQEISSYPFYQENLGLIDYEEALRLQHQRVDELHRHHKQPEHLLFCQHPPVVTLGRQSVESDLHGWTGQLVRVERGGRATYHGPQQCVVYPILDLNTRSRDVFRYLRTLEQSIIFALKKQHIESYGPESFDPETLKQTPLSLTGVWIEGKKVASIGVAVKRWISYHGLAVNLSPDPLAFQGISPCGFQESIMSSIQEMSELHHFPWKEDEFCRDLFFMLSHLLNPWFFQLSVDHWKDTLQSLDLTTIPR